MVDVLWESSMSELYIMYFFCLFAGGFTLVVLYRRVNWFKIH